MVIRLIRLPPRSLHPIILLFRPLPPHLHTILYLFSKPRMLPSNGMVNHLSHLRLPLRRIHARSPSLPHLHRTNHHLYRR